ncbi:hypothetical protein HY797_00440 [Candidatus Falkowbacteria bacterium]|nr:hypothetical protein [Candidatus Falkowbacteria bacterium]
MKKSYIISGVAALVIFAAAASAVSIASAAGNANENFSGFWKNRGQNSNNLTVEEKTARQAEMQTRITAVKAALDAGDYNAWVKAVGENAPILKQINANNFNRFVEAHKLQEQANGIRQELGVSRGGCLGEGGGGMHGFGRLRQ